LTQEGEFIEPPARDRAKKKQARKEAGSQNKSSSHQPQEEPCRFFLRGSCKFGFFGKTPREGRDKCCFPHPKACLRYMDNGVKGCSRGSACKQVHPKMCSESLAIRTCVKIGGGGRCNMGYHVKGTKVGSTNPLTAKAVIPGLRAPKVVNTPVQVPLPVQVPQLDQQTLLASFLGEMIRGEVVKILQGQGIIRGE
jgi:hypothetical protein